MSVDGELPERLLDLIYDAATDESLWSAALIEIADLADAQGGIIFGQSIGRKRVYFGFNGRLSDEGDRIYRERHIHNPWSIYMMNQPLGAVVPSDRAVPLSVLRRSAFFDEVLGPQETAHNAMMYVAKQDDFDVAFNLCRTERQGFFEDKELQFLRRLLPHLRRSMKLGFRLEGYRALQRAEHVVLDRLSVGVILLDRAARILLTNTAARSFGEENGPLKLANARVSSRSPSSARRFDNLVQAALAGAPATTMSIIHPGDGRRLTVLASSVRSRDVARFADAGLRDAAAMLFIFDPANRDGIPPSWVAEAYGLTLAEAKVAIATCSHPTVARTARALSLSPNTVKTHLRRIFAKTGTSRQTDLVRLIASLGFVRGTDRNEMG